MRMVLWDTCRDHLALHVRRRQTTWIVLVRLFILKMSNSECSLAEAPKAHMNLASCSLETQKRADMWIPFASFGRRRNASELMKEWKGEGARDLCSRGWVGRGPDEGARKRRECCACNMLQRSGRKEVFDSAWETRDKWWVGVFQIMRTFVAGYHIFQSTQHQHCGRLQPSQCRTAF